MDNKTRRVRNAVRIYTCSGKSLVRLASIIALFISACACATQPKYTSAQPDMWGVYCEKYGVDPERPTDQQESVYLDCYLGSVEWEEDINNLKK